MTLTPISTPSASPTAKVEQNPQAEMAFPREVMETIIRMHISSPREPETGPHLLPLLQTCSVVKDMVVKEIYTKPHFQSAQQLLLFLQDPSLSSYRNTRAITTAIQTPISSMWPGWLSKSVEVRVDRARKEGVDLEGAVGTIDGKTFLGGPSKLIHQSGYLVNLPILQMLNIKTIQLTTMPDTFQFAQCAGQITHLQFPSALDLLIRILPAIPRTPHSLTTLETTVWPLNRGHVSIDLDFLDRVLTEIKRFLKTSPSMKSLIFHPPTESPHLFCEMPEALVREKFVLVAKCEGTCKAAKTEAEIQVAEKFLKRAPKSEEDGQSEDEELQDEELEDDVLYLGESEDEE